MPQRPPRIGSKPIQPKKETDPETEQVRNTLKNPFAKHYGRDKGAEQR
jgi:hypothetical protein